MSNESLRKRFNPDGSLLRQQQLRMLDILKCLDQICKKHNIQYWLSSGTLLGAVRHGGFIPWDDDLDVEMLKPDYDKLMKVIEKELPENYILQNQKTDKNYVLQFSKIRDLNSCIKEHHALDVYYQYHGIFIDLFYLEPMNNFSSLVTNSLKNNLCLKLLLCQSIPLSIKLCMVRFNHVFLNVFIFPVFRFLSRFLPSGIVRHTFGLNFAKPRYLKEIFPLKEIYFEGYQFPSPANEDTYLSRLYGDYMSLPDVDNIQVHASEVSIR